MNNPFKHQRRGGVYWYGLRIGRWSFGFEHSTLVLNEQKYMERWIAYLGMFTLRLHKFWRGDEDRAPHNHPFWFITFPLRSYVEQVFEMPIDWEVARFRVVEAFRPHYRGKSFKHIVLGGLWHRDPRQVLPKPFYTIVLSRFIQPDWGFWPRPDQFIHFTKWNDNNDTSH
jgi:hypothetical protein